MKKSILFLAALLCGSMTAFSKGSESFITDYHGVFIPCYDAHNNLQIAIRMYYRGDTPYFLLVNPYTFATQEQSITQVEPRKKTTGAPGYFTQQELESTPYIKALNRQTAPPYKSENYGLVASEHPVNGMFLTVDMCPSSKLFEADFFKALVKRAEKTQQPIPIALAVTGLWMIQHPKELEYLIQQQKKHKLQITWVNHSFSHLYYSDLAFNENFLLSPNTDFTAELLETEKTLLLNHQLPSVFFRFPGLVSNETLILELKKYGLIPLGSNAWLAKGETPTAGSIILVHGNSNEPKGIEIIMPLLEKTEVQLLPLQQLF